MGSTNSVAQLFIVSQFFEKKDSERLSNVQHFWEETFMDSATSQ
jgi:hypothetical protein